MTEKSTIPHMLDPAREEWESEQLVEDLKNKTEEYTAIIKDRGEGLHWCNDICYVSVLIDEYGHIHIPYGPYMEYAKTYMSWEEFTKLCIKAQNNPVVLILVDKKTIEKILIIKKGEMTKGEDMEDVMINCFKK